MRRLLCLIASVFLLHSKIHAQQNTWTWMHGDSVPNQPGNYGSLGIPAPGNKPCARYEACQWTDQQGDFWLYGGGISSVKYSDMWRYQPASGEWTWMHGSQTPNSPASYGIKGVSDPGNTPGSKGFGAATWTDQSGNLWMFGGFDGWFNSDAMWKFEVSTNEWTWMQGSSGTNVQPVYGVQGVASPLNTPGARNELNATWTDNNGNLWLFGGDAGNYECNNDLWMYDVVTNEWAWMDGDSVPNQPGSYGTMGISDPSNTPRSRWCYTSWKDNSGNLWLFGGVYVPTFQQMDYLNDLWKYDLSNHEWTWMNGSINLNDPGIYGSQCQSSLSNYPAGRMETRSCWKDDCNNFWLFGGGKFNSASLNDLWKYNVPQNKWTWVSGSSWYGQTSLYGSLQVPSVSNRVGARMGAVSWSNADGLWLFGGNRSGSEWNDLWLFSALDTMCGLCTVNPIALFSAPNEICPGSCIDFQNNSINASYYQWIFEDAIPDTSWDESPQNICYALPGSYDVTLIAGNSLTYDTLVLNNYITVVPFPPSQSITQIGDTLFALSNSVSYQWYIDGVLIQGATNYSYLAFVNADYSVVATDSNGCEVEAAIYDVLTSIHVVSSPDPVLSIYPNPVGDELFVRSDYLKGTKIDVTIYNMIGTAVMNVTSRIHPDSYRNRLDVSGLPSGVYYIQIIAGTNSFRSKFIKE